MECRANETVISVETEKVEYLLKYSVHCGRFSVWMAASQRQQTPSVPAFFLAAGETKAGKASALAGYMAERHI